MSLIADPLLLMADGELYARAAPESGQGRGAVVAGALAVGLAWGAAAAIWADHPRTRPFLKKLGYRSGREYMLRFPLPDRGRRRRRRDPRGDAIALAGLASYPLWWWLGWDHGRRARPGAA